jgi:transcriptional regulator with XRE-family HTH domain
MNREKNKRIKHLPYTKLKGLLAERGLKQIYLAKLLNLSHVTVNQKINGTLEFTYSEVEKICDALGASTEIFRGQKVTQVQQTPHEQAI